MIESAIIPRAHDMGGFDQRRALPARKRQMLDPFIFFEMSAAPMSCRVRWSGPGL